MLNAPQQAACDYLAGPLLVLAGAGSGKTRVITQKIVKLITLENIPASQILSVTFTNKAAREMSERIKKLLTPKQLRGLQLSTFHNFGLKFIRLESAQLGFKANISIFDSEDSLSLLRELKNQEDASTPKEHLQSWLRTISSWKGDLISPAQALQNASNPEEIALASLYAAYQKQLKSYNAVDFDDLILLPLQLLLANQDVRYKWQNKIRYVLVDEYQDTNTTQYALIKTLVYPRGALTVVGDDHQSVYAWRGARPQNLMQLSLDFPNLKIIKLEQNYRSTPIILRAANTLIAHNPNLFEKKLWSSGPPGDPIRVLLCRDDEQEALRIASEILSHKFQNRSLFSDYAILYRSNHQARVIEKALREHHLPYHLSGGTSFFQRIEVRDVLSYLRVLVNPEDDTAFLRIVNIPKREIGPATLEKLSDYARARNLSLFEASFEMGLEQTLSERAIERLRHFTHWLNLVQDNLTRGDPLDIIQRLIKEIHYEEWLLETSTHPAQAQKRMGFVHELIKWLGRLLEPEDVTEKRTLQQALNTLTLMDILDKQNEEKTSDALHMMTLHAAKGLEFDHVFIAGMEEGFLPHKNSLEQETLEEERRLCYVGITRARTTLTLTLVRARKRFNEVQDTSPSRFLSELPHEDLRWEGVSPPSLAERAEKGANHIQALRALLDQKVT